MAIPKKVINFLEKAKIKYETIEHRMVYTAFDKAATLRAPEKMIGKTLVMKVGKKAALILIPANKNLDIPKLEKIAKTRLPAFRAQASGRQAKNIVFIKEAWMKKNLKGVKIGAIPPFGNLWGLPTFIDRSLINSPKIILNSGDYNFSIKLKGDALKKLILDPVIGSLAKVRK